MVTVASLLQIMNEVDSLNSSHDLQSIRAKSFISRFYLVLHACVQTFDVMFLDVNFIDLNKVSFRSLDVNLLCLLVSCLCSQNLNCGQALVTNTEIIFDQEKKKKDFCNAYVATRRSQKRNHTSIYRTFCYFEPARLRLPYKPIHT